MASIGGIAGPIMEKQMDKNKENEMDIGFIGIYEVSILVI